MSIYNIEDINKLKLFRNIISNKKYNELYIIFGKNIYNLFTPNSYKKQDIEKLMNNNDLGTIYNKYGNMETLFIKNFSKRKKEDIKKLLSEKKYIDIYSKYGESEYSKHTNTMYKNDIEYETGSKVKAKLYSNGKKLAKGIKQCTEALALITTVTISLIGYEGYVYVNNEYDTALINNSALLQEYDEKINTYADNINNLNLDNDLEIVMKVMYDMWNDMGGYGTPTLDVNSLGRLAFTYDDGVGVCRNIADDFSARMNAINPEYNARNVAVYIENEYDLANIERNIIENNDTVIDDNNNASLETIDISLDNVIDKIKIEKIIGNHMVSIFEPIGKDYTLVVDSTNPSIGVINNGQIYMLSSKDGSGLQFKPLGQLVTIQNYDYDEVKEEFNHHFFSNMSNEELTKLNNEWGLDAQNEALVKIENKNNKQK